MNKGKKLKLLHILRFYGFKDAFRTNLDVFQRKKDKGNAQFSFILFLILILISLKTCQRIAFVFINIENG